LTQYILDPFGYAYVVNTGFEPVEVDLGKRLGKLRLDSYELRSLR
jgi:hypothetical protein